MRLIVCIEQNGSFTQAGIIEGRSAQDARFSYLEEYMADSEARPISISLPFQKEIFSEESTKAFFDGLLPEGFTRKTVAARLRADERDYVHILSELGRECLGAIRIKNETDGDAENYEYERIAPNQIHALAAEGTSKSAELITKAHLSLTGAGGKIGLYYDKKERAWYLPKGCASSTHIVKQSHVRMNGIVANEQLSMLTAKKLGIEVPSTFIINTGNRNDPDVLFATERYDRRFSEECRVVSGMKMPLRIHQEDFAQALGITPIGKYERPGDDYLKLMMQLLRNVSADPIRDQLKLWDAIVFDYLIGNTDCHLKNFSLLYSHDMKSVRLAPVYDVVSTAIYESTSRDMALNIGGKYDLGSIGKEDFINEAEKLGIGTKIAMQRYDYLQENLETALSTAAEELVAEGFSVVYEIKDKILQIHK